MSDEIAFLRTISANPAADAPRLVYADWLDEQGETARAEFIRLQLELARLPPGRPRNEAKTERERQLLGRHGRRWRRQLGPWIRAATFQRGLIQRVEVTARAFLRHGAGLLERAPISAVRLIAAGPLLAELAASPLLSRLRELDLRDNALTAQRLRPLAASPNIANLTALMLGSNRLGDAGAAVLADSAHLAGLERLDLGGNAIHGAGLEQLGFGRWPALTALDLSANDFSAAGLARFLDAPLAGRLRALDLGYNDLQAEGAAALADSDRLMHVTELNLAGNRIGDAGAAAIAGAPGLAALERLDLGYNRIGLDGARALAQSHYLGDLRRVMLHGNRLSRAAIRLLQRRFGQDVMIG